jgi:hypothetical protein
MSPRIWTLPSCSYTHVSSSSTYSVVASFGIVGPGVSAIAVLTDDARVVHSVESSLRAVVVSAKAPGRAVIVALGDDGEEMARRDFSAPWATWPAR